MLVEDIALYLDSLGYGTYYPPSTIQADNNIFLNYLPAKPDRVIAIYDVGGEGKPLDFSDSKRRVQVIVRDAKMVDANYLAWVVHNALTNHEEYGYIVSNLRRMRITSVNTPYSIGKDQNNLSEFSINFDVWTSDDL